MSRRLALTSVLVAIGLTGLFALAEQAVQAPWDGSLVQYGTMHEAIGQRQHQGRVALKTVLAKPHFYGVAALEGLGGEITIVDGRPLLTRVGADGKLTSDEAGLPDKQATMLAGAHVPSWAEQKLAAPVGPDEFDAFVARAAGQAALAADRPFPFVVEGELTGLRLHVIHGACPMHARLKRIELPKELRPFEAEYAKVKGTLVGLHAKDAVGQLTHPATSTHVHVILEDAATGKTITGHVERVGLAAGTTLRLPRR